MTEPKVVDEVWLPGEGVASIGRVTSRTDPGGRIACSMQPVGWGFFHARAREEGRTTCVHYGHSVRIYDDDSQEWEWTTKETDGGWECNPFHGDRTFEAYRLGMAWARRAVERKIHRARRREEKRRWKDSATRGRPFHLPGVRK